MSLTTIVLIYLLFRLKQLICDFLLQTSWMAMQKGLELSQGAIPLIAHSAIHAFFTLIIATVAAPEFWWLAIVDFFAHGTIDRIKAVVTTKNGWTPADDKFWWALGIDQEAHNLTHLLYIVIIYMHLG